MCGRFTLKTPVANWLADLFPSWLAAGGLADEISFESTTRPRYNIAPTQPVLVARMDQQGILRFGGMRWGLLPAWATSLSVGYNMINARSESISDKPSFRPSLIDKRCVVFADGYYEWKKLSVKNKQPYWIHTSDERVFAMAGLWAENRKVSNGDSKKSPVFSATIITTASSEDVVEVHDRMPAILFNERQISAWLNPALNKVDSIDCLLGQLVASPTGLLQLRRVSTLVNSPVNDGAELLAPYV